MRTTSLARLLVALKVALIVGFMVPFWHRVYLISHRPTSPDPASGYVEGINQGRAVYFITRGEELTQNVMWDAFYILFAVTGVLILVTRRRRARET